MFKQTKKLLFLPLLFCLVLSCNKGDSNKSTPFAPYAQLVLYKSQHIGFPDFHYSANATFVNDPFQWWGSRTFIGGVSLNGVDLTIDSTNKWYELEPFPASIDPDAALTWQVNGNGTIPTGSFIFPYPCPVFSGTIPDTIDKNQNLVMDLSTLTGADSVYLAIDADSNGILQTKYYGPAASVTINSSDLAYLQPNQQHELILLGNKNVRQTLNGKGFFMIKSLQLYKFVWVK